MVFFHFSPFHCGLRRPRVTLTPATGFRNIADTSAHALSAGGDADLGWRMVKAAEEGNLELVERFLADGVPIDSVTKCVAGEYARNGVSGANGYTLDTEC